jgi:hypothetical protein
MACSAVIACPISMSRRRKRFRVIFLKSKQFTSYIIQCVFVDPVYHIRGRLDMHLVHYSIIRAHPHWRHRYRFGHCDNRPYCQRCRAPAHPLRDSVTNGDVSIIGRFDFDNRIESKVTEIRFDFDLLNFVPSSIFFIRLVV